MGDDRAFLLHIRDALREVREFVEGEDYESFLENRMVQNAVMRSFEVVGEAARRVSPGFREAHPEVPWRLQVRHSGAERGDPGGRQDEHRDHSRALPGALRRAAFRLLGV